MALVRIRSLKGAPWRPAGLSMVVEPPSSPALGRAVAG